MKLEQGYPKDHVDIKLLRLKSFTVEKELKDEDVTSSKIIDIIVDLFSKMEPLVSNTALFILRLHTLMA